MIIFTLNHEVNARTMVGKADHLSFYPHGLSELSHLHLLLRLLHRIPERRRLIILLHAVVALHNLLHPGRLGALSLPRLL